MVEMFSLTQSMNWTSWDVPLFHLFLPSGSRYNLNQNNWSITDAKLLYIATESI